jgi:hypothetical protein
VSSQLDRIEAWAKFALKNGGPEDKFEVVLALVNVAKAAEGVMTQMDYETPHHTRLREALAVLGKEPQA